MAVPLFLMVTGALILDKEMIYKDVFNKRIFRILIPMILVTIFSCLIYNTSFVDFIKMLFFNGSINNSPYWLWYLYLLIGLYIMTPFLQKMIKNFTEKDFIVFIIIFVFAVGLINESRSLFNLFFHKDISINQDICTGLFSISVGYFIAGYYLNNLKISSKTFKIFLFFLFFSLLLGTFLLWYGTNAGFSYDSILKYSYFIITIPSICTFVIIKYFFCNPIQSNILNKIIHILSNSQFGVYLFHAYLIEYFQKTRLFTILNDYNSFFEVLLLNFLVLIILTVIINFLKKIPVLKRFL